MVGKQKSWLQIIPRQTSANEQQKRTNTWRSAKGKPAHRGKTNRIHRKGKEDVRRLFWWDKLLRKQPNTHHH